MLISDVVDSLLGKSYQPLKQAPNIIFAPLLP